MARGSVLRLATNPGVAPSVVRLRIGVAGSAVQQGRNISSLRPSSGFVAAQREKAAPAGCIGSCPPGKRGQCRRGRMRPAPPHRAVRCRACSSGFPQSQSDSGNLARRANPSAQAFGQQHCAAAAFKVDLYGSSSAWLSYGTLVWAFPGQRWYMGDIGVALRVGIQRQGQIQVACI